MLSLIAIALGMSVGYGIDQEEYSKNTKSGAISSGLELDLVGGIKGIATLGSQIETDVKHGASYVYHDLVTAKKDISTDVSTASKEITKVLPNDVYHAIHISPVVQDVSNDVHTASKDVYHTVQSVTKDFSHIFHW